MATEYRIDLLTPAGAKVAEVLDCLALAYRKPVDEPGLLTVNLPATSPTLALLERDGQAIVYRRNPALGLDWTQDFIGLFGAFDRAYKERETYVARFPGLLSLLGRRSVAYRTGTANRSDFASVKAETIAKTLVEYNAGPSATVVNGRIRTPNTLGVVVAADQARGNTLSYACAWANLLTSLRKLAKIGGGDFALNKTGAQQFVFEWYAGQLGTDRSATVSFALGRGNMAEPHYVEDHTAEKTVAIVGGQGEGDSRAVAVRTSADYGATNDVELFVDGRSLSTTEGLNADGDAALAENQARREFTFKVVQTPGCFYGQHYFLGDLVTAQYGGLSQRFKVKAVNVSVDQDGKETVDVETAYA